MSPNAPQRGSIMRHDGGRWGVADFIVRCTKRLIFAAVFTATRTWTWPDRNDTVAGLQAQTFVGAQTISNTTQATTGGAGALVVSGGIYVAKDVILNGGSLGLGIALTGGNGLLQLASGTTKANGIAWGTDTFLYRSGAGILNMPGTLNTGDGVSTGDATVEIGALRTGSGNVYIDMHATSGTDYELRIIRASGTNGATGIQHTGTGGFSLVCEGAASLTLATNNTSRLVAKADGQVRFVPLSADPAGAEDGDVYYNSTTNKLRVRAGGAWVDLH